MKNLQKPEFYQEKIDELEEIVEEIREITSKLRGIARDLGYQSRQTNVLESYVIGYLRGITGDEPTIMMSLQDVIAQCEDDADEAEYEEPEVVYEKEGYVIGEITKDHVLEMRHKEGLVCLGTGGDLMEWLNGVNEILVENKVTTNPRYFKEVFTFIDYDMAEEPINCILFPFTNESLEMGRLAIVRLQYPWMKWLSDYIDNNNDDYECEDDATYYEEEPDWDDEDDDCPLTTPEEF